VIMQMHNVGHILDNHVQALHCLQPGQWTNESIHIGCSYVRRSIQYVLSVATPVAVNW
jgi:hypothetical protein